MVFRRSIAIVALFTVCGLTAGCISGSHADGGDRLRVALPSSTQPRPWTDEAKSLTQLGIVETLTRLDENQQAQPLLAQDWVKQLDRHWRIRLRENVVFHDGMKLTAEAAALALNRATQTNPPPPALKDVNITARAVGTRELLITTDRPDPALLERLSSPSMAILSPAFQPGGEMKPAGTGPFKVISERQGESLRLDAFDSYWGGRPVLSGVDGRFVPDGAARAAALRDGDVDVATDLPVSALPGDGVREVPLPRTTSLYLNTAMPPFADPALRAVVGAAIDRQAVVRGGYQGHADIARTLLRQKDSAMSPPQSGGTATGQRIELAVDSDRPELLDVALVVAESLRARGFLVEQVAKPYRELEPDVLVGRFDVAVMSRSYVSDSGDPVAYFASDFKCLGKYNFARLCDPAVDAAISNVAGAPDRVQAASGIESMVLTTLAVVPLVHERGFIGYGDRITGVREDPYERELITSSTARK